MRKLIRGWVCSVVLVGACGVANAQGLKMPKLENPLPMFQREWVKLRSSEPVRLMETFWLLRDSIALDMVFDPINAWRMIEFKLLPLFRQK